MHIKAIARNDGMLATGDDVAYDEPPLLFICCYQQICFTAWQASDSTSASRQHRNSSHIDSLAENVAQLQMDVRQLQMDVLPLPEVKTILAAVMLPDMLTAQL